ncbi:hypothetical protein QFC24_001747 [Naganishia onofrii]|uniref:Uncharacterized protein n=1 Tax=Naganishia onofrii TaxID=1851511 RepID=A0ACC2XUL4_9TREE|nr:hypothetical protein QFC24_001747 [Naganishia onofrii]
MGQTASSPTVGATMPTQTPKMAPEHPIGSTAKPPPECPMHASNASASPYAPAPAGLQPEPSSPDSKPAQCPVQHGQSPLSGLGGGSSSISKPSAIAADGELNPLNQMPTLSHQRAPGQEIELPTERTTSTIPRPHAEEKVWEYPSPQQFYNALVRKGWETPEEHVETMVDIHNFLNEEAWQEVLKWESGQRGGRDVQLARFQGRPGTLSPKATLHLLAGKLFPSKFNSEPPFDRHDWIVHRPVPSDPHGPQTQVRYIIDYYSAPEDADGNPVFFLDVRPAVDSLGSVMQRVRGLFWSQ